MTDCDDGCGCGKHHCDEKSPCLKHEADDLRARLAEVERENARLKGKTYCAFCGHEVELDDEAASGIALHLRTCAKHPMREVEAQRDAEKQRADRAEATIAKARAASVNDSAPCPLCTYENGRFVKACRPHEDWHSAVERNAQLRAALEMVRDAMIRTGEFPDATRDEGWWDPRRPIGTAVWRALDETMVGRGWVSPERVKAVLLHLRACGTCAEDSWSACEGGRAAEALLAEVTR